MKIRVPVSKANRLVNCGNTVLVSCSDGEKYNMLPIAWQMPVSHNPMMLSVAIGRKNYSHDVILNSREFVINIPTSNIINEVITCGKSSGRNEDKFALTGLTALPSQNLQTPLIKECIGHIEIANTEVIPAGDHSIFCGKAVSASAEKGTFNETWDLDNPNVQLIFHWGGQNFTIPGPKISF